MDRWMDKFTERLSGTSYVLALLWGWRIEVNQGVPCF